MCGNSYPYRQMTRHIKKHYVSNTSKSSRTRKKHFVIKVSDFEGIFWMYLEVAASIKLSHLDGFLRGEWLECCGHLSSFSIDGKEYDSDREDEYVATMNHRLSKVLYDKAKFLHMYDFGSTTELRLSVVAIVDDAIAEKQGRVTVLARNDKVSFFCNACGSKAVHVCCMCGVLDGVFCDKCAHEHECGVDMMLPVAQSPRVGTCGYGW